MNLNLHPLHDSYIENSFVVDPDNAIEYTEIVDNDQPFEIVIESSGDDVGCSLIPVEELIQEVYAEEEPAEIYVFREDEAIVEEPTVRCMECDAVVDVEGGEKHLLENCFAHLQKPFKCTVCLKMFNSEQNFNAHKIVSHCSKDSFKAETICELCSSESGQKYNRFHSYIAHVLGKHVQEDNFSCKECHEEFSSQVLLKRHKRWFHASSEKRGTMNEVAFCPQCGNTIALEDTSIHQALHLSQRREKEKVKKTKKRKKVVKDPKKMYACNLCPKAFRRPSELKRHLAVHERKEKVDLPMWTCAICKKEYSHVTGLNEHKRIAHGNAKGYGCKLCGSTFTKQSNLRRHSKQQHPEDASCLVNYPYECGRCPSVFTTLQSLGRHQIRNHTPKKSISIPAVANLTECKVCKITFNDSAMLRVHQQQQHKPFRELNLDDRPKFACERCSKKYVLRASLMLHMDMHRQRDEDANSAWSKVPTCKICMIEFYSKRESNRHMAELHKSLAFQPGQPHLEDIREFPLTNDFSFQHTNRILCRLCKPARRFATMQEFRIHNTRHLQRRPHLCWTCHKSFRTEELLTLHKVVHNREPMVCDVCQSTLYGRMMYRQHLRNVHHQGEYICFHAVENERNAASAQPFPENPVQGNNSEVIRAQSADWTDQAQQQIGFDDNMDNNSIADVALRCDVCQHVYDTMGHLIHHWAESSSERDHSFAVLSCPLCNQTIRGASEVANHIQMHHWRCTNRLLSSNPNACTSLATKKPPSRPYQCEQCFKSFSKKCDLDRHLRIHNDERPFGCIFCDAQFRTKSTLDDHLSTHKTVTSDICTVCQKSFYGKKQLKLHLRIHTGEKPLQCRHCVLSFRTSSLRCRHERRKHGQGPSNDVSMAVLPSSYEPLPICEVNVNKEKQVSLRSSKRVLKAGLDRTIGQISGLPSKPLQTSQNSAFSCPKFADAKTRCEVASSLYIVVKTVSNKEFFVSASTLPPAPNSIRETVDTVSVWSMADFNASASQQLTVSVVLHDDLQLNIDTAALLDAINSHGGVETRKFILTSPPVQHSMFEVYRTANSSYLKRCDVCEVEFYSKESSNAHFASEDHETAQLMHPLTSIAVEGITPAILNIPHNVPITRKEELSDFTCKLCGRKFLDMEPLVAHIRREHERDGDHPQHIPPRPAARTAPIH